MGRGRPGVGAACEGLVRDTALRAKDVSGAQR